MVWPAAAAIGASLSKAAPAIWSAIGSMGSSLIGGAFGANSARKQRQANAELQSLQYYYQRELNKNAYQDTTYSMREAGINPMLAITNGASGGSAGLTSVSMANPPTPDFQNAINSYFSAKQLKNDTQRVENESNIAQSTVNKQQYEADLAHEQSALINEQNRQLMTYGDLERQQGLINSAKTADLLDAQRQDVQNQMFNRNMITNAQVANLAANSINLSHSSKNLDYHSKQLEISNQFDRGHLDYIKKHPWRSAFGINPYKGTGAASVAATGASAAGFANAVKSMKYVLSKGKAH